jgi:hypothetical protein
MKVEIKDFDYFRAGSKFPACLDIQKISTHECYGVFAQVFTHQPNKGANFAQLRKNTDFDAVALFSFLNEEMENELPYGWKNSIVLWDSRSDT